MEGKIRNIQEPNPTVQIQHRPTSQVNRRLPQDLAVEKRPLRREDSLIVSQHQAKITKVNRIKQ